MILKTEKLCYVISYLGIELVKYKYKLSLTYLHILYVCFHQMPNDYTEHILNKSEWAA